ncbi:hypothetical protein SO802_016443 [Lithocarpus litseifolius]|uniref:Uncharacterized protein n=1 Tax=Lithocarpus litseifolius TaxID=425828 RepID=A0AAW2CWJ6_9ROSI
MSLPPAIFTPATTMAVIPFSGAEDAEGLGGNGNQNSSTPRPNLASSSSFRRENWVAMHTMQDSRKSGIDINISTWSSSDPIYSFFYFLVDVRG